jgi:hypothetical protein
VGAILRAIGHNQQPNALAAHGDRYEPGETAKALGLTFQQVQKYEKGANRMGSSRLQQAADVLGVAAAFFFEGAGGGLTKWAVARRPQPISTSSSGVRKDCGSQRRLCAYAQRSVVASSVS